MVAHITGSPIKKVIPFHLRRLVVAINTNVYYDQHYPIYYAEPAAADQRYVGGANASDSNDGTVGNPWASLAKAIEEYALSSTWYCLNISADMTIQNGTANPGVDTDTSKYWNGIGPGTLSQFGIIRKDPAVPNITITINDRFDVEKIVHTFWDGMGITLAGTTGFMFGVNSAAHHHTIRHFVGQMTGSGGDNVAFFMNENAGPNYFGCFQNKFIGPGVGGSVHPNTSGFIVFSCTHHRIENNEVENFPRPYYFKHANDPAGPTPEIYWRNNYAANGESFFSGDAASGVAEISNNLFVGTVDISNGGGGLPPGGQTILHNTIIGNLKFSGGGDGEGNHSVTNAVAQNNIITGFLMLLAYQSVDANTNLTDWNLIGSGVVYQFGGEITLAQWQSTSVPSGQDANSIAGLPTFSGGSSPTTIAGYALSGGFGVAAANDGADMGANVSLVGVM
jgi:hypothetical protein